MEKSVFNIKKILRANVVSKILDGEKKWLKEEKFIDRNCVKNAMKFFKNINWADEIYWQMIFVAAKT